MTLYIHQEDWIQTNDIQHSKLSAHFKVLIISRIDNRNILGVLREFLPWVEALTSVMRIATTGGARDRSPVTFGPLGTVPSKGPSRSVVATGYEKDISPTGICPNWESCIVYPIVVLRGTSGFQKAHKIAYKGAIPWLRDNPSCMRGGGGLPQSLSEAYVWTEGLTNLTIH